MPDPEVRPNDVAVIGMCGRFPGAPDLARFWSRLRAGDDLLTTYTDAELAAAGVPEHVRRDPAYVKRAAVLPDAFHFDHEFFGYTRREARMLDPQQRILLEVAWELLETVGYSGAAGDQAVGVFAGASMNTYLTNAVARSCDPLGYDGTELMIANDKDYLTTRISYKLGLKGPSINVQTACSTSLVAVHLAVQSLLTGECDIALAGGVSVIANRYPGYFYSEGMILSPDGRCRPFDADGAGTTFGDGVGLVALKRLAEAIKDGDQILAVVKGSAINNDGSDKIGYTAPSIPGQRAVITEAQAVAEVDGDTITYVEAHGTATVLGDPVEFTALSEAFADGGARPGQCALGSVKANVGHLAAAAGIAGFIKAVLALRHRDIPGHPTFTRPNPRIDLAGSPFHINTRPMAWPAGDTPRRAGVSSFGIGGTNAHVVLEEAPALPARPAPAAGPRLLALSARTDTALRELAGRLARTLADADPPTLADVAHTLRRGRLGHPHRHAVAAHDHATAVAALRALADGTTTTRPGVDAAPDVTFLFDDVRVEDVAALAARLPALAGIAADDPSAARVGAARALATLWTTSGVRPAAAGGTGAGEVLAACFAGALDPADAAALLSWRAGLRDTAPQPRPKAPTIPLLSAVTGGELTTAQVLDPLHWTRDVWTGDRLAEAVTGRTTLTVAAPADPDPVTALLTEAARLWADGVPVDWSHWSGGRPRRVPLPAQPLHGVVHRIEPPTPAEPERGPAESPYTPSWQRLGPAAGAPAPGPLPDGPWLLFADSGGVGDALAGALRARNATVVLVRPGGSFDRTGTHSFDLDPADPDDHRKLFTALTALGLSPRRVVHLWSLDITPGITTGHLDWAGDLGPLSVLDTARQLAGTAAHLAVLSRDVHDITGAETVVPGAAMTDAVLDVVAREFPGLRCRAVDIGSAGAAPDVLLAELTAPTAAPVALRHGQRWTRRFLPVTVGAPAAGRLRPGGTYLVTGGLGRLGLAVAGHLARTVGARLVLTGRSALPPAEAYDRWLAEHGAADPLSRRIEAVRALERLGGTVLAASADVTDARAMRELVGVVRQRFGRVDGWFHCAGAPAERSEHPVDLAGRAAWRAAVAPRVRGAQVLTEVLADSPADFGVMLSSLDGVWDGPADPGHAAAGRFLDALAPAGSGLVSVGWDATTPERVGDLLDLVLRQDVPSRLAVSATDLDRHVQQRWHRPEPVAPAVAAPGPAPRGDELKRSLARLWSEVLRTEVDRYELSLFDLGGDELLAVRLARRIEEEHGTPLTAIDLLAHPTIDQLAARLESDHTAPPSRRRAGLGRGTA